MTMMIAFLGQSAGFARTISAPQSNLDLYTWATANGYPGSGKADITIDAGVYVYATSTANAGLTIPSAFGAGNLTLTNNGYIIGQGGQGAGSPVTGGTTVVAGTPGGPAMAINTPITLTNNSYIAGGGGGGATNAFYVSGAGGAGGGASGAISTLPGVLITAGVTGGAIGNAGPDGYTPAPGSFFVTGGAGGRILPGVGGASVSFGVPVTAPTSDNVGLGGGAGASGATSLQPVRLPPGTIVATAFATGGGGGWGSAGGTSSSMGNYASTVPVTSGAGGSGNAVGGNGFTPVVGTTSNQGSGGAAINLNGNTITYPATGTIWGSVA